MIDVSELITDPDFCINYTIERSSGGVWTNGLYSETTETIETQGIIQPYDTRNTEYSANGDQITGDIKIWNKKIIYTTRETTEDETTTDATSDVVIWQGERYKVHDVKYWNYHGYYSAIGTKVVMV